MKTFAKWFGVLAALCLLVALAGCSNGGGLLGGFGLGNPPIGPGGGQALVGGVSGTVLDGEGNPLAGVSVYSTDGVNEWETTTDEDGNYALEDITAGARVISFAGNGFMTAYDVTVIGETGTTLDVTMETYTGPELTGAPVVTLDPFVPNEESGIGTLTGTITGLDAYRAVVTINGSDTLLTLTDADGFSRTTSGLSGSFSTVVILAPGANTIVVSARNALGATSSDPVQTTYTPAGDLFFRATLTWDGTGDIDLFTWDPSMNLSCYWNMVIPTGNLDVDNTWADGPENFTCEVLEQGRYRVAVNSYSRGVGRKATLRVTVGQGPNAGKTYTFGPYTFTENSWSDGMPVTGNTAAWWRPCDILVSGSTISAVAPDSTPLDDTNEYLTRGGKKK